LSSVFECFLQPLSFFLHDLQGAGCLVLLRGREYHQSDRADTNFVSGQRNREQHQPGISQVHPLLLLFSREPACFAVFPSTSDERLLMFPTRIRALHIHPWLYANTNTITDDRTSFALGVCAHKPLRTMTLVGTDPRRGPGLA
jgi:hypothetical protein